MSTRMKFTQKPPLAKSPIRTRARRTPQSSSMQTPPGSLNKSLKPNRVDLAEIELRPEYLTISCELKALAKRVRDELGDEETGGLDVGLGEPANTSPLFVRGRFYEEYSARRNERLKRKKGLKGEECSNSINKSCYSLGVSVESSKIGSSKKIGGVRRSISGSAVVAEKRTSETPRYMLRSMSKENQNKPPLPLYSDRSVTTRRLKKSLY